MNGVANRATSQGAVPGLGETQQHIALAPFYQALLLIVIDGIEAGPQNAL